MSSESVAHCALSTRRALVSHCVVRNRRCRNFDHDAIVEDDRLVVSSTSFWSLREARPSTSRRRNERSSALQYIRRNDRRAREVHVIAVGPRAAALELGAKDVP